MKYISNGKEVTKEEFESLVGEQFKWFQNDTVNAVDYSSVSNLFDGDFKSQRQINDHVNGVLGGYIKPNIKVNLARHKAREEGKFHQYPLTTEECFVKDDVINSVNRGEKEMMESLNKTKTCSPQCYCDVSCKKEIKEPFSIQVPKPNPFNQPTFFNRK